jgi:hypothetical protein
MNLDMVYHLFQIRIRINNLMLQILINNLKLRIRIHNLKLRIRILQKVPDPYDPDSDPEPQHWLENCSKKL